MVQSVVKCEINLYPILMLDFNILVCKRSKKDIFIVLFSSFSPDLTRFAKGNSPKAIVKYNLYREGQRVMCNRGSNSTELLSQINMLCHFLNCSPDFLVINCILCLGLVELKTGKLAGNTLAFHFRDPCRGAG